MTFRRVATLFAALTLPFGTAKALNWNELTPGYGDLSGDGNSPTSILFSNGSNLIEGTMGRLDGIGTIDADAWTFTIDAGYYLTGINLVSYSDLNTTPGALGATYSFMAIQTGSTISMSDPLQHLSNGLWNEQSPDGGATTFTNLMNILLTPQFSSNPSETFTSPLGSGTYTFWVQETTAQISYCIDFVVTPVPEPGSAVLLAAAGILMMIRRRSRL